MNTLDMDARGPHIRTAIGAIHRRETTLDKFAKILGSLLGRPVLNNTGLPGPYFFALDWTPGPNERPLPEAGWYLQPKHPLTKEGAPPITQALQEQHGLTITPKQAAITVLIIDQATKPKAP